MTLGSPLPVCFPGRPLPVFSLTPLSQANTGSLFSSSSPSKLGSTQKSKLKTILPFVCSQILLEICQSTHFIISLTHGGRKAEGAVPSFSMMLVPVPNYGFPSGYLRIAQKPGQSREELVKQPVHSPECSLTPATFRHALFSLYNKCWEGRDGIHINGRSIPILSSRPKQICLPGKLTDSGQ